MVFVIQDVGLHAFIDPMPSTTSGSILWLWGI